MKQTTSQTGFLGEAIAERFLEKKGFSVFEKNYRKKWGEIDLLARKDGILYFIEVKSVSCETLPEGEGDGGQRPEENVHPQKLKRLSRAIQSYLAERDVSHETPWQFDVIAVFLDRTNKKALVRRTENVLIS